MAATGEHDERICLHKFKLGKYKMPDETEFTVKLVQSCGNLLNMEEPDTEDDNVQDISCSTNCLFCV